MFFSRQVQFVHPQHDVLVAFKILHLLIQAQAQVGPVGGIFLADQQLAGQILAGPRQRDQQVIVMPVQQVVRQLNYFRMGKNFRASG